MFIAVALAQAARHWLAGLRFVPPHLLAVCGCLIFASSNALAQGERRGRYDPSLIVECGTRVGACDALTFTRDGKHLLAAGDDKVVRIWKFSRDRLDVENLEEPLRWSIYRERRGAIYGLALSPDEANRHIAIAGYGVRNGSVVVLDRSTRRVVHALVNPKGNSSEIWSLAYSPSGEALAIGTGDGAIWLWNLTSGKRDDVRRVGQHEITDGSNLVRLIAFLGPEELLSVAENGPAQRWNLMRGGQPSTSIPFQTSKIFRAALSPNRKWLAAAGQVREHNLELLNLRDCSSQQIKLDERDLPHSLAFDSRSERLAVGIRTVPMDAKFFKETDDKVIVYDLGSVPPQPQAGPKPTYHAEGLAFHPDGFHLAVAGGNDHETTLWDLRKLNTGPVSTIRSPGSCLWGVGLARDGRYLGYQTQRAADPKDPNLRGQGPWTAVFELHNRRWAPAADFRPEPPLRELDGWTVQPSPVNAYIWFVISPDGKRFELPLRGREDAFPRCYAFLPASGHGKVRLAVGHYWGASIFELGPDGPRRVRLFNGHQGEVMALAASADGKFLITAGRDQTIMAWSLARWPSQRELGARFSVRLGELRVDKVDPGSPAWEAELTEGDDIVQFKFNGDEVPGGPARWKARLEDPVPGLECWFRVKRVGQAGERETLTTVRQRPLWCFFPTRDGEWVFWRWRDYYYDTSTRGDSLIGWQINADVDKTPPFYPAEQFQAVFKRPEKVAEAIRQPLFSPDRIRMPDWEPPELMIRPDQTTVSDVDLLVTVCVTPRGPLE